MPANEFEKKVQQKMDELQLRPSPEVWSGVEQQIRREKRRRRVLLFWWLLPVLLAGGITTYLLTRNQTDNATLSGSEQTSITQNDKSTVAPSNDINKNLAPSTAPERAQESTSILKDQLVIDDKPVKITARNRSTINSDNSLLTDVITPVASKKKKTSAPSIISSQTDDSASNRLSITTETPAPIKAVTPETVLPKVVSEQPATSVTGSDSLDNTIDRASSNKAPIQSDSILSLPSSPIVNKADESIRVTKKRWQLGIEVRPGVATTWRGKLFESSKDELVYAAPNGVGNTPGPVLSFGPLAPPVLIESPSSFISAGIDFFARKSLSSKLDFKGALQYQYISTKIKVGEYVEGSRQVNNDMSADLAINSFYRAVNPGNRNNNYTNQYHLAGISTTFSWKLINTRKLSLSWDNGISLNQLLHTNALLFDANLRSYYRDFDAFRKTQVFYTTGLTVPLLRRKNYSLALSPFASYGLTPVLKSGSELNSHFLNFGMGLKFTFPGK